MLDKFFKLPSWILIIISIFILISLAVYSWYHEKDEYKNTKDKISNYKDNAGEKILISYSKIIEINDQQILVKNRRGDIFTLYPVHSVQKDEYYSFYGKIRKYGRVEIIQQYPHPKWQLKHLLSLLSIILVLYYIIKYIRLDKTSYMLYILDKRKNNA